MFFSPLYGGAVKNRSDESQGGLLHRARIFYIATRRARAGQSDSTLWTLMKACGKKADHLRTVPKR